MCIRDSNIDEDCNGKDLVTVSFKAVNDKAVDIISPKEEELAKSFSLYPNPTNGLINIEHNGTLSKGATIEVIDAFGKLVLQDMREGSNLLPIDVQQLHSGLLIVRITTEQGIISKRVVLVKEGTTGTEPKK